MIPNPIILLMSNAYEKDKIYKSIHNNLYYIHFFCLVDEKF